MVASDGTVAPACMLLITFSMILKNWSIPTAYWPRQHIVIFRSQRLLLPPNLLTAASLALSTPPSDSLCFRASYYVP
ncbi:hypothetical protein ABKN59_010380 [Abortiporus biennis]